MYNDVSGGAGAGTAAAAGGCSVARVVGDWWLQQTH